MKRNPLESDTRARMAPGALSRAGFLGDDARNISDIVAADAAALAALGVTTDQVADCLDAIHAEADRGLGAPRVLADGKVTVRLLEVMGRIPCPFGCGYRAHKAAITVSVGAGPDA